MAQLPSRLEKDTVLEAVFDLRFEPEPPNEAVFDIIYPIVLQKFSNLKHIPLPILQLPEAIRNNDEQFKYQPLNRLQGDRLSISIGPRVVSFSTTEPYIGWRNWKPDLMDILNSLFDINLIKNVEGTGLRYLNFIEENVFTKINAIIEISNCPTKSISTTLRTEIPEEDDYIKVLQITDNALIEKNGQKKNGSLLDIDIIQNKKIQNCDFKINLESILDKSHTMEKEFYFTFLRNDFIKKLGPVFDEG